MKQKTSFLLHHDTLSVIEDLTNEQVGELIREIYKTSVSLNNPDNPEEPSGLKGLMNSVFHPFKAQLLRDYDKYVGICERNKSNGSTGGRPSKPSGGQANPENPDKPDSHSDSHSDNVNEDKQASNKFSNEHLELARYWAKLKQESNPTVRLSESIGKEWADIIRLMVERDKYDLETIKIVMNGIQDNDFWCSNFTCMKKFRKHMKDGQFQKFVGKNTPAKPKRKYFSPDRKEISR